MLRSTVQCICIIAILFAGCKSPEPKREAENEPGAGTPVTVTTISTGSMTDFVEVNATSAFLQKNYVKANVNGYVQSVDIAPGTFVHKGQVLFIIKTKEAQSIDNSIRKLDTTLKFSGTNTIKASSSGYITQLNHQNGDYVQDGEQLAAISDENSFAFILNLPYELKPLLSNNHELMLSLADGTEVKGSVSSVMPNVDAASQTMNVVVKVDRNGLPENLIAKVRLQKTNRLNTTSLPKAAVLTNDVQSEFWIMLMKDSTTAVKVPVKKGIESGGRVEILEPKLNTEDKIVLTGNFGLPDTAKVKIEE